MLGFWNFFSNFDSVILYYLIYAVSFCFFLAADKTNNNKKTIVNILLGVLILSIFAGIRDLSVGIDTDETVQGFFIPFDSLTSLNSINYSTSQEPFYRYFSFVLHQITYDSWVFLFSAQFLTAGAVAIGLYKYRFKTFISIGMLFYMLLFYQNSLNIIRQSIAAAVLFWAFVEFLNGCYLNSAVLSGFSTLFHKSGIIGVFLVLIVLSLARIKKRNYRMLVIFTCILVTCLALLYWKPILIWMANVDLIPRKFLTYVTIFSGEGIGGQTHRFLIKGIGAIGVIRMAVCSLGAVIAVKILNIRLKKYDYEILSMKYAVISSLILYAVVFFMLNTVMGWRVTIFLEYIQILFFSRIYTIVSNNTELYKNGVIYIKNLDSLNIILYPFVYNIVMVMMIYSAGTVPYILTCFNCN